MRLHKVVIASSVLYAVSYAQAIRLHSQNTFQIRGKIEDFHNAAIIGAEVKFEGSKTTETVFSDSQGFYYAKLPTGLYRMTVAKGPRDYTRALFRVSSHKTIVLDA